MDKYYIWDYVVLNKKKNIIKGIWVTNINAKNICSYFEDLGYEIISLNRVEENYCYNTKGEQYAEN